MPLNCWSNCFCFPAFPSQENRKIFSSLSSSALTYSRRLNLSCFPLALFDINFRDQYSKTKFLASYIKISSAVPWYLPRYTQRLQIKPTSSSRAAWPRFRWHPQGNHSSQRCREVTDTNRNVLKQRKQLVVTLPRVSGTLLAPRATVWDEAWANRRQLPRAAPSQRPPRRSRGAGQEAGRRHSPQQPDRAFPQHPQRPGPLGEKRVQPPGCHGYGPPPPLPAARSNRPPFKPPRRVPRMRAAGLALPSAWCPRPCPAALSMRSGPAGRWCWAGREGGGWGGSDGGRRLRAASCCPPSATCGLGGLAREGPRWKSWDETGWREIGGLEKKSSEKKGEKRRGKMKNKVYIGLMWCYGRIKLAPATSPPPASKDEFQK